MGFQKFNNEAGRISIILLFQDIYNIFVSLLGAI